MNHSTSGSGRSRHVLFCTDFSANADGAFALAVEEAARAPDSRLTLLHVLPEPEAQFWKSYIYEVENVDAKARADIDRKLEADYRPQVPEGLDFQTCFRTGNPAQTILDVAREESVDLVVLGRQGHGSVFYGNVASRVARHADCPVLIVPMAYLDRGRARTRPAASRGGPG